MPRLVRLLQHTAAEFSRRFFEIQPDGWIATDAVDPFAFDAVICVALATRVGKLRVRLVEVVRVVPARARNNTWHIIAHHKCPD